LSVYRRPFLIEGARPATGSGRADRGHPTRPGLRPAGKRRLHY